MRGTLILGVAVTVGMFGLAPATQAAGRAPDNELCNDTANPPKDALTQGGCLAIARAKGNCQACHFVTGVVSGNIAPPLTGISQRFPDRARLRAQIEDPAQFNPQSVMPPYGRHQILTAEEIDKLIQWLLTL